MTIQKSENDESKLLFSVLEKGASIIVDYGNPIRLIGVFEVVFIAQVKNCRVDIDRIDLPVRVSQCCGPGGRSEYAAYGVL